MRGIEVQDVSVRLGRQLVLDAVDLTALPGRITGLVGPNGAGKSTLLAAISGERFGHGGGHIRVDGREGRPPAGTLAYLRQRAELDGNYPVQAGEVVDMGRTPLRAPWRRRSAHDRARVVDALERVGLSDHVRAPFGELSGGQQQRVLLARSLAQEAAHLLLDEPFVGVDAGTTQLLEKVLAEQAARGVTVIVVDHGLERVGQLCDHLVLLDHRVLAAGPPREVLDPALLASVFTGLVPAEPPPTSVERDPEPHPEAVPEAATTRPSWSWEAASPPRGAA